MMRKNDDAPATKADLAVVQTDVAGVKADLAGVKTDVAGVKTDLAGVDRKVIDLGEGFQRLALSNIRIEARMDSLEGSMRAEMSLLKSEMFKKLDQSVDRMQTIWRESALLPRVVDEQGRRLDAHDKRISALESARS